MKALNFNTSSWHFLLATKIAKYRPLTADDEYGDDAADICTYTKHVVGGAILMALMALALAVVGYLFFNLAFAIGFSLVYHMWLGNDLAVATIVILMALFTMFLIGTIVWKISDYRYDKKRAKMYDADGNYIHPENRIPEQDSFVKHAYKSWKGKFCVPINFVSKNEEHDENIRSGGPDGTRN
jgi:hypothetical protein